jgi:hypothetical protein
MLTEKDRRLYCTISNHSVISDHSYEIDAEAGKVTCTRCKREFTPMHVLLDLCREESLWMYNREDYKKRMEELEKRQRTKCYNCGKMTTIS